MWWKSMVVLLIAVSYQRSESALSVDALNSFDMVNFNLVYGETYMNFSRYYIRDYLKLLSDENFSFERKTLLYVHGWIEDYFAESTETIVNAYIQRGDHNIIVIDWGQYSISEYFAVIPRFTQFAKMLGRLLVDMFERGLDIDQLHCVGHSFGAHIMGIMGREVTRSSYGKYKLKRITGLDPAHVGFYPPILDLPLAPSDAEFVDAIHTDSFFIGTVNRVGHVDFYPNNALMQPGCPPFSFSSYTDIVNSFCSHHQAWRYWSESVKPGQEQVFPSLSCKNYKDFQNGKCDWNQINFMGYGASPRVPGKFYIELRTDLNLSLSQEYFMYLANSYETRSDFTRIGRIISQFFKALAMKRRKS